MDFPRRTLKDPIDAFQVNGKFRDIENAIIEFEFYKGTGSPEGVVHANRGAIYIRTDGGSSTCLYVKEASDGLSTGWAAK